MKLLFHLILVYCCGCALTATSFELSDYQSLKSKSLGYEVQYQVFLPPNYTSLESLPVIFITDGPGFIHSGKMPALINRLIQARTIEPIIAVFVDSREPKNLKNNRRNTEFFCNPRYAEFFTQELVPFIDSNYLTSKRSERRAILGLSFGALNSACFGILAPETFKNIGMLSPAMHPVPKIYEYYERLEENNLNFFLSSGTIDDNLLKTRKFRNLLRKKGYRLKYKEVREGHDWGNWKPLLDDVLRYFFPQTSRDYLTAFDRGKGRVNE